MAPQEQASSRASSFTSMPSTWVGGVLPQGLGHRPADEPQTNNDDVHGATLQLCTSPEDLTDLLGQGVELGGG